MLRPAAASGQAPGGGGQIVPKQPHQELASLNIDPLLRDQIRTVLDRLRGIAILATTLLLPCSPAPSSAFCR